MTAVETGAAVPLPPPPPVPESEGMEPVPFARKIYDMVLLHDGMTVEDLYARMVGSLPSETWREYIRWNHGGRKVPHTEERRREANRQYFDRGLDQGLERGWLVKSGRKIIAGQCPPEHRPLSFWSNERAMRAEYQSDTARLCMEMLRDGSARHRSITRRTELRASLREIGQLYPILRWSPGHGETLIIDGQTRYEILTKDLKRDEDDIWFFDLPSDLTAAEAMQRRIHAEMMSTSKDVGEAAREQYIADLATKGITQKDIAKIVGTSQQRVSEVMATRDSMSLTPASPTEEQVEEFQLLADHNWSIRAIAERTGFSKSTVGNYLSGSRTPPPPPAPGEKPVRKKRATKQRNERVSETAAKRGTKEITVGKMSPAKAVIGIVGREDIADGVVADDEAMTILVNKMIEIPAWEEHLVTLLRQRGWTISK